MRLPVRRIEGSALGHIQADANSHERRRSHRIVENRVHRPLPVGNPIKLRAVDYELGGRYSRFVGALPARFFRVPGHILFRTS